MLPLEDRLATYEALLRKWQASINLISNSTVNDIQTRHFDDSLQILPLIPETAKIIVDLGSGAGFPALPLAMARPDLEVHCIESDHKKCTFLKNVSRETLCGNLTIHCGRIESVLPGLSPDLLTARALASLSQLLDWGGMTPALYLKGRQWREEVEQAQKTRRFDYQATPSQTDSNAAILWINPVSD